MTGAALALPWRRAFPFDQSPAGVTKFSVTLPGLGPGGANNLGNYIPVLSPDTVKFPGTDYYEVQVAQYTQQVHPAIAPTAFYGYADAAARDHRYLGGVIVATRNRPVKLKVTNLLPPSYMLPVDATVADPMANGRTDLVSTHLHGGLVFWDSDGGPFHAEPLEIV